jgi:septum site-determining protein MinD
MVARGDMISVEDILDILAIELIGVIPEDESILISTNQGLPVAMTGVNGSSAGQAFTNVARRLEGEVIPFLDLTPKSGLFVRVRDWMNGR